MDKKNKGKEAFDKSSDAVRVLLVDDDKSCHLELARMLQECGCDGPTDKKIEERMEAKGAKGVTRDIVKSHKQKWEKKQQKVPLSDMPRAPAAMNISPQPHIGAPQIMIQPSSSRQTCNDLPGGQAFDGGTSINASTNLLANNPQNQNLDEIVLSPSDTLDLYWDFTYTDTFDDIDFNELDNYLSKDDKQIP